MFPQNDGHEIFLLGGLPNGRKTSSNDPVPPKHQKTQLKPTQTQIREQMQNKQGHSWAVRYPQDKIDCATAAAFAEAGDLLEEHPAASLPKANKLALY